MAIHVTRAVESGDILVRITDVVLSNATPQQFAEEMSAAIKAFVREDPDVRILINEMVKQAFSSVDLLSLVTEAVKTSVSESTKPSPSKT